MSGEDRKKQALVAMDMVIQGLQTGMWGITSGYLDHPPVAASIVEGFVRLYLNSLHIYHDADTCAKYAASLMEVVDPFTSGDVQVSEDDWMDSLSPPLLEQLG